MNNNIKAIALDIDGILIGKETGQNFPLPCPDILNTIKLINQKGILVILCTGRPFYTPVMETIINAARLDNFHIGDMGSLVMNPIRKEILIAKEFDKKTGFALAKQLLDAGIYTSLYTPENYFIQKDQINPEITPAMTKAIDTKPKIVDSLMSEIAENRVLYFISITKEKSKKEKIAQICLSFKNQINLLWSNNPSLAALYLGNILPPKISKADSLQKLLKHLKIPFENVLGIGDGDVDWDFMKLCGYRATLQNALPQVKQSMATINDASHSFTGSDVDQNGVIEIFHHFNLLD